MIAMEQIKTTMTSPETYKNLKRFSGNENKTKSTISSLVAYLRCLYHTVSGG